MAFIEAKEIRIRNLFSNSQEAYKVPLYQRNYEWTPEQWRDLLEDLLSLKGNDMHFLGSIVVVPVGLHRQGINYFEIVDGQQRIATLLILLATLRNLSEDAGNKDFAKYINDTFLIAKDWEGNKEIKVPKLTLSKLDRDAFISVLNSTNHNKEHPVIKCHDFYVKEIKTYPSSYIQTIVNTILDKVDIVHINALNYLNAFRLFETLNDRGLELSATDLIKNFLLMKVAQDEPTFTEFIEEWNEMYLKVRDKEPVKFVRRYMLSFYSGVISERKLYEEIKSQVEGDSNWDNIKILNFAKDLNKCAEIYENIFKANFSNIKINNKIKQLHMVEVSPSYTLLLRLIPLYNNRCIDLDKLLNVFDIIEAFHIRWGVCGQSTSRLDSIYNKMSNTLSDIKDETQALTVIRNNYNEALKLVDDDTFFKNFKNNAFKSSETRTKFMLWKLSEPTGETILNIDELQTDHIMPKKLSSDWIQHIKSICQLDEKDIKESHSNYLNRIGNLTPIKGQWNNRMSNKLFEKKKLEYINSEMLITKKIV